MIRNVKRHFPDRRKMTTGEKMYLHKGMVFTRPGNYTGKYTRFLKK